MKYLVTVTCSVQAVIEAPSIHNACESLADRIENTQCWQAWGEPETDENNNPLNDLIEWPKVYPEVDRMDVCVEEVV